MKRLWAWLLSRLPRRSGRITLAEIFKRTPEMSAEKMLECFAVDLETPLLVGVLHVLKGIEEIAKEETAVLELKDSERAFLAGGIRLVADTQKEIIELVENGNEAKRNERRAADKRQRLPGKAAPSEAEPGIS